MDMENFKTKYLEALEDPDIIARYQLIFEPIFQSLMSPITDKLQTTIDSMAQSISTLKKEAAEKDNAIKLLKSEVAQLKISVDALEQHGRKDSIRIFGLPESTPGSTDEKVVALCNGRMRLSPPLQLEEIAVSHRVGLVKPATDEQPSPPRPLLVKFVSRRSKTRVMEVRKNLRKKKPPGTQQQQVPTEQLASEDEEVVEDGGDDEGPLPAIYIADDLTKHRATLAYKARVAKREHLIADTWVHDGNILIKNKHSRIYQIRSHDELNSCIASR